MTEKKKQARWLSITGPIYVYLVSAEERMKDLKAQFPDQKFRVAGSASRGYGVQRREEAR